ncbi:MAG: hypothetical protein NTY34_05665 [Candidatus Omnitrophica bacterium]|nr:hypothetical protein [Candidatus Omnitrophota bacterium]
MFMMKGALALFMSLAIGYVLCILADKHKKGLLQTVGYTLGTAIIVLSLLYSVLDSCGTACVRGKTWRGSKSMKCKPGMFMKGNIR